MHYGLLFEVHAGGRPDGSTLYAFDKVFARARVCVCARVRDIHTCGTHARPASWVLGAAPAA